MEKIKNRKNWLAVGAFVLLSFLILFSWNSSKVEAAATPTKVVVNPGHGGTNSAGASDPGAVSNGFREVDLNNALAIKTVLTLRASGYDAILSHPVPGSEIIPEKPLLDTAPTMNNYSATISAAAEKNGADLIIAIHHNSDGGLGGHGYEFYWSSYHPGIPEGNDGLYSVFGLWTNPADEPTIRDAVLCEAAKKSKELANSFNENFKSLDYITSRDKITERDDAITKYPNMPSVLIEAGFVSNNAEAQQLANGSNQQKMADQILASVNSIFGTVIEPITASSVTATVSGNQINVSINGISAPNGINTILVPTWSDINGQDDIKWYTASAQSDGSYSVAIDIKDHNYDSGVYNLHCYGTDTYNKGYFLGNTTVTVAPSKPMTATSLEANVSGSKITATVKGITAPIGIKEIQIPVWSDINGQDDIKWYTASAQSNGSYSVTIDIKDHNYDSGVYNLHCYGTDTYNKGYFLGNTTVTVAPSKPMTATGLEASVSGSKITATVKGITAPIGIKEIQVPVWSDINGQDDIKWYTASAQSDGSYSVTIDIKDHKNDVGIYNIHFYGTDNNNKQSFLGNTTVTVATAMTATNLEVSVSGSKITATVKGITAPNGIKQIQIPVWSDINGQDDIKWYTASAQSDGSYSVIIDTKDHNNDMGIYNIHFYGTDNNNKQSFLGNTTVTVATIMTATSLEASVSGTKITATVKGITAPNGIKQIQIPVWSDINGQDDIKWYTASAQSDGSYSVTIDTKDHKSDTGVYNVHCYGTDNNNKMVGLGATTATINIIGMTATSVAASSASNKITATITGVNAPNGLKQIQIPVWSDVNGQDDIVWYIATAQSDGSYSVTIETKDHNDDPGNYIVHFYGIDNNGKFTMLGNTMVNVKIETMIMGQTTVSAQQLVNYYKSTGAIYPQKYNDLGVNLETFIDMYIQEANAEGVRAEVAFVQAMLETGNLQFGGDVKVGQFNFAGLGAISGVPGFDFAAKYGDSDFGIQMGIRGHIQHLKCYASNLSLNQAEVDPRWADWLRLRSTTVEGLSGTWATNPDYAPIIINIMKQF